MKNYNYEKSSFRRYKPWNSNRVISQVRMHNHHGGWCRTTKGADTNGSAQSKEDQRRKGKRLVAQTRRAEQAAAEGRQLWPYENLTGFTDWATTRSNKTAKTRKPTAKTKPNE